MKEYPSIVKKFICALSVVFLFGSSSYAQWLPGYPPTGEIIYSGDYINSSGQMLIFQWGDVGVTSLYNSDCYLVGIKRYMDIDKYGSDLRVGESGNSYRFRVNSGTWCPMDEITLTTHDRSVFRSSSSITPKSETCNWQIDDSGDHYDDGSWVDLGTVSIEYVAPTLTHFDTDSLDGHPSGDANYPYYVGDIYIDRVSTEPGNLSFAGI